MRPDILWTLVDCPSSRSCAILHLGGSPTADTSTNPMRTLYRRLGEIGLSKAFLKRSVLPAWWDDDAGSTPAGFGEAAMILSRHLGLDLQMLRTAQEIRPTNDARVKLKKPASAGEDDVVIAQRLAVQVARLAALGVSQPVAPLPRSGAEIREQILDQDQPWVSFEALLDYCWAAGIAVLHVSSFPTGARRMHGLALKAGNRPMIVISWERKHPAWLLFVLAHELGHIALGHVEDDGVLVDQEVDPDSADKEEAAANQFAVELLCGSADVRFRAADRWPKAGRLVEDANRIARLRRIDPGHIILNYASSMGKTFFPVAQAALKLLEPQTDGPGTIRQRMATNLDWSRLPAEASEFIARMTQSEIAEAT